MLSQEPGRDARTGADPLDGAAAGPVAVPAQRSSAAARLLERTARDTDQWRSEARSEAEAIVAAARQQAEALVRSAQERVEDLVRAARREAEQTVDAARVEAAEVRSELDSTRRREEAQVAQLQQLSAQHAERLRHHLTDMLDRLDSVPAPSAGV